MGVVGSSTAALRGRLSLLAVAACALAGLLLAGAGASRAAGTRAKGVDVSMWNGSIKWSKVAHAGYRFAFGKATESTTFIDPTYSTNRNGSEGAGLAFGAYHFARPTGANVAAATASGIRQADYFLATADPQPGELPPVLDLEKTGGLRSSLLQTWTRAWVGEIFARLGVQPFVYSSPAFWQAYLGDSTSVAAAGARLWIAHWTSASNPWVPAQNWNGEGWTFWQWTNCVAVPGFAHCSDGDRMNGPKPASLTIDPYPTGVPVLSTPPSLVGPPEAGKLLTALPGTWEGGKPLAFTYQWKRCDAAGAHCLPIDGATRLAYKAATADVGHSLKVLVTATSQDGSTNALTPPTVAVSPAGTPPSSRPKNLSPPGVLGTLQAGQVLTSSVGTWSGSPTKFTYRWQRCDATGASCVAVKGAKHASYTLTPGDIGSTFSLVVTATGAGGATSARTTPTDVVIAAPLPPVSVGSQPVEQGIAGNVQTEDGCATATWQPGAVPVGLTVFLGDLATQQLAAPGCAVSFTVPGLPSTGFAWPVDIGFADEQPAGTVLGYSTDGKVYSTLPTLDPPQLPAGATVGRYVDANLHTHVVTLTPLDLALFTQGAWGDPTYTSPTGPTLVRKKRLRVLYHRADRSVLVLTRLGLPSQAQLTASLRMGDGRRIAIFHRGSRLGPKLQPGRATHLVEVERDRPGTVAVRLRVNGRYLRTGRYTLVVVAVDPWGRSDTLTAPFSYRRHR